MLVRIRKIGNSLAFTIPKKIVDELQIKEGDWVDMKVENGTIIVTPVEIIPRRDSPHE